MISESADSATMQASAMQADRAPTGGPPRAGRATVVREGALPGSARRFAARCHSRQRRRSDGAPFIEHPLAVARLLRAAGCSDALVAAGLLHDVTEKTDVSADELRARFGPVIAGLVQAVSENPSIDSYRQRKHLLLEQVREVGGDAALLFAADKIAKVWELPDLVRGDQARSDATARGHRARSHLDDDHRMRVEHYHASLGMLQLVAAGHPLVMQLADALDACPIAVRGSGAGARA
jgi:hypothetical protein